ncbi:Fas apoptotic inhibitory molecule [Ancylostoma caninum]|uniref:Fas apoptotic inhibitory molecule n=1 Tax=Ancylostoma caninum TaxID=29170 RepID=A0A368H0P8_ANCCA|nr:Fas apoptotic inhibitory molecule [Ancylostoma caninum]
MPRLKKSRSKLVLHCYIFLKNTYECYFPDKESMEVWVNGNKIDTAGEFVADGTETHFEVGRHVCKIRATSSGRKKIGVVHDLYVDGEPIPLMTFSKTR